MRKHHIVKLFRCFSNQKERAFRGAHDCANFYSCAQDYTFYRFSSGIYTGCSTSFADAKSARVGNFAREVSQQRNRHRRLSARARICAAQQHVLVTCVSPYTGSWITLSLTVRYTHVSVQPAVSSTCSALSVQPVSEVALPATTSSFTIRRAIIITELIITARKTQRFRANKKNNERQ